MNIKKRDVNRLKKIIKLCEKYEYEKHKDINRKELIGARKLLLKMIKNEH